MVRQVLLIDDDDATCRAINHAVAGSKIALCTEHEPARGLARLRSQQVDALLLGINGTTSAGLEVLKKARDIAPTLPLIALTAEPTIASTIRAFRLGATDFLAKPLVSEEVISVLQRNPPHSRLLPAIRSEHELLREPSENGSLLPVFAGPRMNNLRDQAINLARCNTPLLVRGEIGVGKETILNWIHQLSDRCDHPFIKVYCDAIHESQLIDMLFGNSSHGLDDSRRLGYLEQAGSGTLLLHNVTSLPESIQLRLANIVEVGQFSPSCSSEKIAFRARIVATTTSRSKWRSDSTALSAGLQALFGGNLIDIPPLRDRVEHIRPLVHALNINTGHDLSLQSRWASLVFSKPALTRIQSHDWPGNVDELRNFIRRMYVFMERPTVEETDIDELLVPGQRSRNNKMLSIPIEGDYKMISQAIIAEAIQLARGNKSAAARSLGLHRKTLYRIMKDGGHRERN